MTVTEDSVVKWPVYILLVSKAYNPYLEDITWWREDMNFMFEWLEQYLTCERSERV